MKAAFQCAGQTPTCEQAAKLFALLTSFCESKDYILDPWTELSNGVQRRLEFWSGVYNFQTGATMTKGIVPCVKMPKAGGAFTYTDVLIMDRSDDPEHPVVMEKAV
jgi:hypothetical protein